MRKFIPLDQLGAEGLREDLASTNKLWKQLENVRRGDSGWMTRPGVRRIGTALPAGSPGTPKLFINFLNPASAVKSEVIRPTGTGAYNVWSVSAGANWAAVDEAISDEDTTYVQGAGKDDKTSFTLGNLVGTYNSIASINISCHVKRHATITNAIRIFARISGVDYSLGASFVDAGSGWVLVTISSTANPATGNAWTVTEVDALEIGLSKDAGFINVIESGAVTIDQLFNGTNFGDGSLVSGEDAGAGGYQHTSPNASARVLADFSVPASGVSGASVVMKLRAQFSVSSLLTTQSCLIQLGTSGFFFAAPEVAGFVIKEVTLSAAYKTAAFSGDFRHAAGTTDQLLQLSSLRFVRTTSTEDNSGAMRVSQVYATVEGNTNAEYSLIMAESGRFLRVNANLTTYENITGTASAFTAPDGETWDYTTFAGLLHVTNGFNQRYTFPTTDAFAQVTGKPVGACIATYGSRLFLGDVTESGSRNESRIRWSKINDSTDWVDASSGNRQLSETPGKIMAMKPILEGTSDLIGALAVYKTQGIYHVSITTDAADPFRHKVMDTSVGLLARGSLVGFTDAGGRESHVFLGTVGGSLQVLAWNGTVALPIGNAILPQLARVANKSQLHRAVGIVDDFNNYILIVPVDGSSVPNLAFVYNFTYKVWSTWAVGNVTAMGTWLPSSSDPVTIMGRTDGFAYQLDDSYNGDDKEGTNLTAIARILTTGDLGLMTPEPWKECMLQRVWMYWEQDTASSLWDISITPDGGNSFRANETNEASRTIIVNPSTVRGLDLVQADVRVTSRKHGIRLTSSVADGKPQLLQMFLEIEDAGSLSPV